jgi:predicted esterase YcpF (UPF0227 family)
MFELRKKVLEETNYQSQSKARLKKILEGKMRTIMIGAIASIEEAFYSWLKLKGTRTLDEQDFFEAFQDCRSQILDKGNTQIRNLEEEISQYIVDWKRYNYEISRKGNESDEDD